MRTGLMRASIWIALLSHFRYRTQRHNIRGYEMLFARLHCTVRMIPLILFALGRLHLFAMPFTASGNYAHCRSRYLRIGYFHTVHEYACRTQHRWLKEKAEVCLSLTQKHNILNKMMHEKAVCIFNSLLVTLMLNEVEQTMNSILFMATL